MTVPDNRYNTPEDIITYIKKLEKRVESLERRSNANTTSIDSSGTFKIGTNGILEVNGGELIFRSKTTNQIIFHCGYDQFGDAIVEMFRESGVQVFGFRRDFYNDVPESQRVRLYDRFLNLIFQEGTFTPGIERPWFELPMRPAATAGSGQVAPIYGLHGWERLTTSATFATVFKYNGARQNAAALFKFKVYVTNADTTGEVQVVDEDTGNPLNVYFGSAWSATWNTTTYSDILPPALVLSSTYGQSMNLGVQIRRTAGTGEARLCVTESMGA